MSKRLFFGVTFCNFAGAGLSFLVSIFLARTLDIASFGKANLIFSIIAFLHAIADFGFGNTVVIYYNRRRSQTGSGPLAVANGIYACYLLAISVIAIPILFAVRRYFLLTFAEAVVIHFSFLLFSLFRYLTAIHQATGEWRLFNGLTIGNNIVKLFFIVSFVLAASHFIPTCHPYQATLAGYLSYSLATAAMAIIMTRKRLALALPANRDQLGEFCRILLPLGAAALFIVISMRWDSLVIEKCLGAHKLGIYSAANTLAFAFPLITGSLMNVLLKASAEDSNAVLPRVIAMQKRYLPLLLLIFIAALFLSGPIISLLFGTHYAESAGVFRLLLVPYLGGVFFTPLESHFYAHEPRTILYLKFIQMCIVVILSLLFIGTLELYGVAAAICLSRLLGWVYLWAKSRRIISTA